MDTNNKQSKKLVYKMLLRRVKEYRADPRFETAMLRIAGEFIESECSKLHDNEFVSSIYVRGAGVQTIVSEMTELRKWQEVKGFFIHWRDLSDWVEKMEG